MAIQRTYSRLRRCRRSRDTSLRSYCSMYPRLCFGCTCSNAVRAGRLTMTITLKGNHVPYSVYHTKVVYATLCCDSQEAQGDKSNCIGLTMASPSGVEASVLATAPGLQTIETSSEGLLVIVIDTNPQQWFANAKLQNAQTQSFQQLISSTLVFVNSYLLLHRNNRIVIIAAHAGRSEMLYPDPAQNDTSGTAEQSLKVTNRVMEKLKALSEIPMDPSKPNATAIAASISRSLCFINRAITENADLSPRILVIQKSPDVSEHYISIMNGIFSAQKKNVAVDACILSREHSPFMQQAAYLTGGIYYKPNDHSGLLEYLLSIYLPDPSLRKLLKLPTQDSVDFRAMCFCHQEVVSTAYVCPVCLSLFCEFKPICSTCGIRSRIQPSKKLPPSKRPKSG